MKFISLVFFSLILTSCATTGESEIKNGKSLGIAPNIQSTEDINKFQKAIKLLSNNKLSAAKELFTTLMDVHPDLAGPYANLAIIALRNNKPVEAQNLINQSLQRNPNFSQALNLLGYIEQIKGNFKAAEINYIKAIKNKPNYAIANYNLALLYDIYMQDITRAIPYYERYMDLTHNKDKITADWLEQIKTSNGKS